MIWSPQQAEALDAVGRWLKDSNEQVFRLFGYAGTGKSTLARHIAENADAPVFCAFTGKAALVMRRMGCVGATTIHRLIYHGASKSRAKLLELEAELVSLILAKGARVDEVMKPSGIDLSMIQQPGSQVYGLRREIDEERARLRQPAFQLNEDSSLGAADLLVVDECSMVDGTIGADLLKFGTKTLVLGDPAQLPPVYGAGFFTDHKPDFMLTEIHRQARDNPIIDIATRVREGQDLPLGEMGDTKIITKSEATPDDYLANDQMLVGKNNTRRMLNMRVRARRGIEGALPIDGDRLVCLKNDHRVGLLNGSIWTAGTVVPLDEDKMAMTVRDDDDDGKILDVEAHTGPFYGREYNPFDRDTQAFDFGYALTVHKAQGSQWDSVTLIDEWHGSSRKEWLYTGITRAAKKLTIIRW